LRYDCRLVRRSEEVIGGTENKDKEYIKDSFLIDPNTLTLLEMQNKDLQI